MKKSKAILLIASLLLSTASTVWAGESAYSIIKKGDQQMRGNTSISTMKITVIRQRYKRTILLDAWDHSEENYFFIRIKQPEKDKGVTFLKTGNNRVWQYIPRIGKEIKIEASLMYDSWMGSDFTNDDLVKQSSIVNDYNHSFLKEENSRHYKILLKPKPNAAVIWGRIIIHVRKDISLPVKEEFYDHKGRLKKVMTLENFKKMGGRTIPAKITMMSVRNNKVQSKTIMVYENIRFNQTIPSSVFSKSNLRK